MRVDHLVGVVTWHQSMLPVPCRGSCTLQACQPWRPCCNSGGSSPAGPSSLMCADAGQWSRMRALVTQVTYQLVVVNVGLSNCMGEPVVRSAGAGDTSALFVLKSRCGREPWSAACLAAWSGTSLLQAMLRPLAYLHTVLPHMPVLLQVSHSTDCKHEQLSCHALGQKSVGMFGWYSQMTPSTSCAVVHMVRQG